MKLFTLGQVHSLCTDATSNSSSLLMVKLRQSRNIILTCFTFVARNDDVERLVRCPNTVGLRFDCFPFEDRFVCNILTICFPKRK